MRKVIIDTDCGVDDAIALTMALSEESRKKSNVFLAFNHL